MQEIETATTFYIVEHLNIHNEYCANKKKIGIYTSYALAEEAINRVKDKPGFCDSPEIRNPATDTENGFYILKYEMDKDHYEKGFDIIPEDASEELKRKASCSFAEKSE